MSRRLPLLLLIPHGGTDVPEEWKEINALDEFDLFIQSDTCANEIFALENMVLSKLDTGISRFFVDLDRPPGQLPPKAEDGVVKTRTLFGKPVFLEGNSPDSIAVSNVLKRYYTPYHEAAERVLSAPGVRLILECHTRLAAGPPGAEDAGEPRPLILVENVLQTADGPRSTCPDNLANDLVDLLKKNFAAEERSSTAGIVLGSSPSRSHILSRYGCGMVPAMKISLSKALFLDDEHFNYDYLRVDEVRIGEIRKRIARCLEKISERHLG